MIDALDQFVGPINRARAANQSFIQEHCTSYVLVHAAVASKSGATVIIPGQPEAGKSTLVAGLTRAGWQYTSDELAMFVPHSITVAPYARAISIDTGAYTLFPELVALGYDAAAEQWHVKAEHLGGRAATSSIEVSHVVFNTYVENAGLSMEAISQAHCLHGLIKNSIRLQPHQATGFETLAKVAETCDAYRLEAGVLEDQIAALEGLVKP